MLCHCILLMCLSPMLPAQLTLEAQEAAKARETQDYYTRWIGVRAPEFDPNVRDRLHGPAIRLEPFRGKKVLLYSFDSGDFVRRPEKDVFPANLQTLHRVRQDIGVDRFVVIGFTSGTLFFWSRAKIPDEIRELSGFPIAQCAVAAERDAADPYHLLARPGGVVIDRNGVIQAIFTKQMTDQQLRSAIKAPVWSKPAGPAPVDDRWKGEEPPMPLRNAAEIWSRPVAGVVALTRGDWDLNGVENVLVLQGDKKLSVLDPSGHEKFVVPIDGLAGVPQAIHWCGQANGKSLLLKCGSGWPKEVPVFGETGEKLWDYPRDDLGGIDSASWVDIDGDGSSEMLVGFSGGVGLHLVSNAGKRLWTNTDVGNCFTVAGFDARGGRPGLALSTDAKGAIVIFSADGRKVGSIRADKPITTFAVAEMNKNGDRQVLFTQGTTVGTVDHAVASDLAGNIRWQYPIVSLRPVGPRTPMVAADITGDGTKEWVFQSSAKQIVAVDTKGRLVAQFPAPGQVPTLVTAVQAAPGEPEIVVLGGRRKLIAYAVSDVVAP